MTPDVNVLVAASRSDHPHHAMARGWLEEAVETAQTTAPLALQPMVTASFLRLVTHPKIFVHPTPVAEAMRFVDALLGMPGVSAPALGDEWPIFRALCMEKRLAANELPDYLPLFLEYLSTRPLEEALNLLSETVHILGALEERLAARNSPYAAVLAAIRGMAGVSLTASGDGDLLDSVSGDLAASVWRRLKATHLAAIEHQVVPRLPLPVDQLDDTLPVEPPALIKGYLRMGARVLGPPAWDPDFNTADLPMMMRIHELPARYRKHFLKGS